MPAPRRHAITNVASAGRPAKPPTVDGDLADRDGASAMTAMDSAATVDLFLRGEDAPLSFRRGRSLNRRSKQTVQ